MFTPQTISLINKFLTISNSWINSTSSGINFMITIFTLITCCIIITLYQAISYRGIICTLISRSIPMLTRGATSLISSCFISNIVSISRTITKFKYIINSSLLTHFCSSVIKQTISGISIYSNCIRGNRVYEITLL